MRKTVSSTTIETLEARIAPANITGTLSGSTLKISAISSSTAVGGTLVQVDPDSFDLYDGSGASPLHFDAVRSVQVALTDLNDTFSMIYGLQTSRVPVTIKTGAGNDQIGADGSANAYGDFSIVSTGTPNINFTPQISLRGDVKIATEGGGLGSSAVLGSLTSVGLSFVQLGGVVAGNVKITQPDGAVTVQANGIIHGDLTVVGGVGLAGLTLTGTTDGNIKLNGSAGAASLTTSGDFKAGRNLSVGGGDFADTVSIGFSSPDVFFSTIHGSVNLALGGGGNVVTFNASGRISGYVRISTGDQDDGITMGNFVQIGGALQLALGGGTNSTSLNGVQTAGGLKYAGGAGNDSLSLQNTTSFLSPKVTLGDGTNSFSAANCTFENGLSIKGGISQDTVTLGGTNVFGKTNVALGNGANQWQVFVSQLRGGFGYQGGIDSDVVVIDNASLLTGSASVKGGEGSNAFQLKTLSFLSAVSYTTGAGGDAFLLEATAPSFARIKVALGDGTDFASINTSNFATLRVDGGLGGDTIERLAAAVTAGLVELNFESTNTL